MLNRELTPKIEVNGNTRASTTQLTDTAGSLVDSHGVPEKRLAVPVIVLLGSHEFFAV